MINMPFANFINFQDCVKKTMAKHKGWKKERASAYCAVIERRIKETENEYDIPTVHLKDCDCRYALELMNEDDCGRIEILNLEGFNGVKVHLCKYDDFKKVQSLQFDKKIWDKDSVKLFLKRYGKDVLNFGKGEGVDGTKQKCPTCEIPEQRKLEKIDSRILSELAKEFKLPYEINFIALKEGKFNGVYYRAEDLAKSFQTLKDKDITIDHGKSVKDIVGKVTEVTWNESERRIEGKGLIYNEALARQINQGLVKGVSVEVFVDYVENKQHGVMAANPEFVALSIVSRPACPTGECGILK